MKVINPANGSFLGETREDDAKTIAQKFEASRQAQKKWASTPLSERIQCIQNFRKRLEEKKEQLSLLLTDEVGKPIRQSRNEIVGTLTRIDFFVEAVPEVMAMETVHKDPKGFEENIEAEPLGVVANISAWNYPYFVGANVFLPALLTGNAVLYKPSEFSSLTGKAIAETLHQSGIPKDIFQLICGGREAGAALLKQPVDGVFFTGSLATGRKIAESAPKMARLQLELGGKDPSYICEDSDVESAAASTADGAFYNTGQSCCSVERIYVHEKVYEKFMDIFMREVRGFTVGNPRDEKTYIGPLTRADQIKVLEEQTQDAVKKGAKVLFGGHPIKGAGNFFEPTVLANVDHTMKVMKEESFGPIIGIQKVKDDSEAVSLMNDSDYGLTAGVYSKNREHAEKILKQLSAGSLYWNCCDRVSPRLPWSGRKGSGIGWTLSKHGIQSFLQYRAWHLKGAS